MHFATAHLPLMCLAFRYGEAPITWDIVQHLSATIRPANGNFVQLVERSDSPVDAGIAG